jgi:hypothetical protein
MCYRESLTDVEELKLSLSGVHLEDLLTKVAGRTDDPVLVAGLSPRKEVPFGG